MPRVYNSGPKVDFWYENDAKGNGSSTWDLCIDCFNEFESRPVRAAGLKPYNGDPEGVVEGPMDSPPLEDMVMDGYRCASCNCKITMKNYEVEW